MKRNQVSFSETYRIPLVQSLVRGLQILECFAPGTPELSLQQIADRLGIPKGSAFRTVSTLERLGYLRKNPDTKSYQVGIRVLDLGFACLSGMGYPEVGLPYLEELAREVQDSASMAVLDGDEIVYVARASVRRVMSVTLSVGSRLPAHCTSMGKVLLAFAQKDVLDGFLRRCSLQAWTPKTIVNADELRRHLETVRKAGFAINDEELELGLRSVAAPVRDRTGRVVAAINVSMLAARMSRRSIEAEVAPRVVAFADRISASLGFRPVQGNLAGTSVYRNRDGAH